MNKKDKLSLDKNLSTIAAIMAEAYMKRCNMPSIPELLKETGNTYKKGKFYRAHIEALQKMLVNEYKVMGLDLATEVEKHGGKFKIGEFSEYENAILVNKIQNLVFYTNKIKEYKNVSK